MTTFLNSPSSPKPVHGTFYDDERSVRESSRHTANLSGATMLDLISGPEGTIAAAYNEATTPTKPTSRSKRVPNFSATKSQLRQTNRTLLEIVQNIQAELAFQREAMLDMQTRIYHLETRPCNHVSNNTSHDIELSPPKLPSRKRSEIRAKPVKSTTRETPRRRDAHQKHGEKRGATNKEGAFWKSPTRFSGFNFNFDLLETVPSSRDAPEVIPVSPPVPEKDEQHDPFASGGKRKTTPRITRVLTGEPTAMYHDVVSDIREHVIDFDRVRTPIPPILQSPPRSSRSKLNTANTATTNSRDDEITALPQVPVLAPPSSMDEPQHHRKGIKSLFMYRTFSKSYNKSDFAPSTGDRRSGSLRC
ncbi:hypothetical protein L13192_04326 [Pyrenophora tritici-repentis]|uniref:Uncharacterized protein n=2 Tax=Pyrenophora tritici-repentis TaxID=45151 RepID=A0A922SUD1_9PLEO|nr:hypothetical protein Ptr86124_011550 [Pyrenophora tritici-repentis]KAI1670969.1 hypothetical protein L13192_04326 [Pyrenophora tritici-repentis]KAI1684712.1 hypothetical protein KJE20_04996 [Pyrenophora tritici-repentis]PZD00320.1 hypothetical protein A1F95_03015 [Pyrenophora tritici-repentis]